MNLFDKMSVILDTDIGSDVDDAVCLAYLLKEKRCDLKGIVTVSGEADKRASLASMLCKIAGRDDIPIFAGCETPICGRQLQTYAASADVLEKHPHNTYNVSYEHIAFMAETIRNNPGKITIIAIGPLTNIAVLFSTYPDIPKLVKKVVIMGGVFNAPEYGRVVEWNIECDPYAAKIVFDSDAEIFCVGLDVTMKVNIEVEKANKVFSANPLMRAVSEMATKWFLTEESNWYYENPTITFHDPLTAVSLFNENVCEFAKGNVEFNMTVGENQGQIFWTPDAKGKHNVAVGVDVEKFFDCCFSTINK